MPIRPENRDRYPADWAAIRRAVLDRAGDACEFCTVRNGLTVYRREVDGAWLEELERDELGRGVRGDLGYVLADPPTWRSPADGSIVGEDFVRNPHGPDCGDGERLVRIVLTIAHLDHVPEHCDPANLRALCQQCHNRHDAPHRAATRRRTRLARQPEFPL